VADDFTKRKFSWLDQVARDRDVSGEGFRLAYILASDHLNRGTGDAWPSQDALAEKLGLRSPRSIKHLVDQLEARGHVEVTVGRGRGHSNRYAPLLHAVASDDADDVRQGGATLFPEIGAGEGAGKRAAAVDTEAAFEAWWLQYPLKVSKGHARRAYKCIIRSGKATVEELLAGVLRYAAERDGKDPKYTKHGTTWFSGECWRDETARPVSQPAADMRPAHRATGVVSAIAGIGGWLDNGGADGDDS